MKNFVSLFIKRRPNENTSDFNFRAGNFASVFGLFVNLLLFGLKLAVGLMSASMAIVADAVNNLSDSFSNCISIVSFQIAKKPADKEHPFGHARVEYLFSSVLAIIIVIVGVQLFWHSLLKIREAKDIDYSLYSILVLSISILLKLFLSSFYMAIAKMIKSPILEASSADSRADVLSTSVILISIPVYFFTKRSIDSYLSLLVSILIIKSGFEILKDTIDRILGTSPSYEESSKIKKFILSYDGIEGVHDMIIHDYGTTRRFVSAHAEVDSNTQVLESHAIIDRIESDAVEYLGIQLILHMDPVVKDDPATNDAIKLVKRALKNTGFNFDFHDFRLVHSYRATNVIFDLDVPDECCLSDNEITNKVKSHIKKLEPTYNPVITLDRSYIRSQSIGSIK